MRDETVTISTLDKAIAGALEEYNADVQSKLRTLVDNAMRKLVKLTKATAPRGHRRVCQAHRLKDDIRHPNKLRQNVVCTRGARLPHAPA